MAAFYDYDSTATTIPAITASGTTATIVTMSRTTTNCTFKFDAEAWFAAAMREERRQASLDGQRPLERIEGEAQYVPPAWRRCMQPPGRFPFYQGAF